MTVVSVPVVDASSRTPFTYRNTAAVAPMASSRASATTSPRDFMGVSSPALSLSPALFYSALLVSPLPRLARSRDGLLAETHPDDAEVVAAGAVPELHTLPLEQQAVPAVVARRGPAHPEVLPR